MGGKQYFCREQLSSTLRAALFGSRGEKSTGSSRMPPAAPDQPQFQNPIYLNLVFHQLAEGNGTGAFELTSSAFNRDLRTLKLSSTEEQSDVQQQSGAGRSSHGCSESPQGASMGQGQESTYIISYLLSHVFFSLTSKIHGSMAF